MKRLPPTAEIGADDPSADDGGVTRRSPGIIVVFAGGRPVSVALRLEPSGAGGVLEIGRGMLADAGADDDAVSRAHALVAYDGSRWTVKDRGSRNGTFVDGVKTSERVCEHEPVIRLGRAIAIATTDAQAIGRADGEDIILGAKLAAAYEEIDRAASYGRVIHLVGESGSGKELAAKRFHDAGPRRTGPFVPVNCATIPEGVAERLLFGAVRGAFSGADANVDGWLQTADKGTLFLDEIAELDLAVQAKLLRVLESREVMALGAARARKIDFGLCSATHGDLRALAGDGRMREDLYFRIGRPAIRVPPLRERREEIAHHLLRAVGGVGPAAATLSLEPAFVEACLLRSWPGNVRELVAEASFAAQRALAADRRSVLAADLAADAGHGLRTDKSATGPAASEASEASGERSREHIEAALREHDGNVTAAARALGMHRNQLRRWLDKEGVDPQSFSRDSGGSRKAPG